VYWFGRPPIWRWLVAAILVVGAVALELRPSPVVLHPFAASDIAPGEQVTDVEWRPVPPGLLPATDVAGYAAAAIPSGDPLLPGSLAPQPPPPPGWWLVGMEISFAAPPGTAVRVVISAAGSEPLTVDGVLVSSQSGDGFGPATGLVAVPGEDAGIVAAAVQDRAALVLLSP
jgi:hypothetical protein